MKSLLVFSGGMDSATLLYELLASGDDVECLSVNYNQRHKKELNMASRLCDELGVRLDTCSIVTGKQAMTS